MKRGGASGNIEIIRTDNEIEDQPGLSFRGQLPGKNLTWDRMKESIMQRGVFTLRTTVTTVLYERGYVDSKFCLRWPTESKYLTVSDIGHEHRRPLLGLREEHERVIKYYENKRPTRLKCDDYWDAVMSDRSHWLLLWMWWNIRFYKLFAIALCGRGESAGDTCMAWRLAGPGASWYLLYEDADDSRGCDCCCVLQGWSYCTMGSTCVERVICKTWIVVLLV